MRSGFRRVGDSCGWIVRGRFGWSVFLTTIIVWFLVPLPQALTQTRDPQVIETHAEVNPQQMSADSLLQTRANADLPSRRYGRAPDPTAGTRRLELFNPEAHRPSAPNEIGVVRSVELSSSHGTQVFRNDDGSGIRFIVIESPGAQEIRVRFEDFRLSEGDEVYLYGVSEDSPVDGPYRNHGPMAAIVPTGDPNDPSGSGFWSGAIPGDAVIVEVYSVGAEASFAISGIAHHYQSFQDSPDQGTAPLGCNVDANCNPVSLNNAVARINYIKDGSSFVCSATMLNDQTPDLPPYLLTANHCVSTFAVAATVQARWKFRSTACNSGQTAAGETSPVGAYLLRTEQSSDQTLLRISGRVPEGLTYSGWTSAVQSPGESVLGLHHPRGSFLRSSNGSIINTAQSCSATGLVEGYRIRWNSGVTEPGSSGSGIFNSAGHLVGVDSCGQRNAQNEPFCGSEPSYGKFSDFFDDISTFLRFGDYATESRPPVFPTPHIRASGALTHNDPISRIYGDFAYSDTYAFQGTAGQLIAVHVLTTGDFDSVVALLAPSTREIIALDNNSGGGTDSLIKVSLPETGEYLVIVTSINNRGTGAYGLKVTNCTSSAINFGQTLNGSLSIDSCYALGRSGPYYSSLYAFQATAGQQFAISFSSSAFDAYLNLLTSSGSVVAFDDDGGGGTNSRIPSTSGFFTVPAAGTYFIEATTFHELATGAFSVSLSSQCTYSLSPASAVISAKGGPRTLTVNTQGGCAWTATSNAGWITFPSGAGGTGPGSLSYTAAENTGAAPRTGTITIAGQTFTVMQGGICPASPIAAGTPVNGMLSATDCRSVVRSDDRYADVYSFSGTAGQRVAIALTSGAFDTYLGLIGPNGAVLAQDDDGGGGNNSRIPSNSGVFTLPATGVYRIEATSFGIMETGAYTLTLSGSCTYTLSPGTQTVGSAAGTGSVAVTTQSGCNWTATSDAPWLTITSAANRTESGAATFGYTANTNTSSRSATVTVAGQTATVIQQPAAAATCPSVTGLTPASGPVGTQVTIAGANLTGVTMVRFGGNIPASVVVNGAGNQMTATVPAGAQSGPIVVIKSGCSEVSTTGFTVVVPGCPNAVAVSIPTDLPGAQGAELTVPIATTNLTGRGVSAFEFTLIYDPAVLRPVENPQTLDLTGTLSSSYTVIANIVAPGRLRVAGFGLNALTGEGTLLKVRFTVVGATSSCSALELSEFVYNDGSPCATVAAGRVCFGGSAVAGTVSYCTPGSSRGVPGVRLAGAGAATSVVVSDGSGRYQVSGIGGGSFTLTPSRTGDVNGISAFDAAKVARHLVGLETLGECQRMAGDANNNGTIDPLDAALILQSAIGLTNPGMAGMWKFTPPTRSYASVNGNQTGQDFTALLVGDVDGSWQPPAGFNERSASGSGRMTNRSPHSARSAAIPVSLLRTIEEDGAGMTVPVLVGDPGARNILSFEFEVAFDPAVLQPVASGFELTGTLSHGFTAISHAPRPGRLRVAAFGVEPIDGGGALVKLRFRVIGAGRNQLRWVRFRFNDGALAAEMDGRD